MTMSMKVTEHNVRWNCVVCMHSSRRQSSSHYCWHVMRDGSTLFTWSQQDNNSLCITVARDMKSLWARGISTTHGRTLNCAWAALNFLTLYKGDGNDILQWIITGKKSWIHFYKPGRRGWSTREVMLMAFWDCHGLVCAKFDTDAIKRREM